MPGSLARPPQHEHRDKGEEKELTCELTEERDRGPWRRHVDAAMVVAGGPPSRGYDSKGGGIVLTAERPSTAPGGDVGVASCHPTDEAMKGHRKHREARAEASARPTGADQAARAISTGRSSEVMETIGGEVDESPWSEGRSSCAIGRRRSSPESGEGVVGDSESPEGD
jgi:hypothetical protein